MTEPAAEPSVEETGAAGAGEPLLGPRPDDPAEAATSEQPLADRSQQGDDPGT